jgi:hypothetical protein
MIARPAQPVHPKTPMTARRKSNMVDSAAAAPRTTVAATSRTTKTKNTAKSSSPILPQDDDANEQLPPLFLQAVVIVCSGVWLVIALRDYATTGRSMFGRHDDAYLVRSFGGCVVVKEAPAFRSNSFNHPSLR